MPRPVEDCLSQAKEGFNQGLPKDPSTSRMYPRNPIDCSTSQLSDANRSPHAMWLPVKSAGTSASLGQSGERQQRGPPPQTPTKKAFYSHLLSTLGGPVGDLARPWSGSVSTWISAGQVVVNSQLSGCRVGQAALTGTSRRLCVFGIPPVSRGRCLTARGISLHSTAQGLQLAPSHLSPQQHPSALLPKAKE
jgi:hypothetical protein